MHHYKETSFTQIDVLLPSYFLAVGRQMQSPRDRSLGQKQLIFRKSVTCPSQKSFALLVVAVNSGLCLLACNNTLHVSVMMSSDCSMKLAVLNLCKPGSQQTIYIQSHPWPSSLDLHSNSRCGVIGSHLCTCASRKVNSITIAPSIVIYYDHTGCIVLLLATFVKPAWTCHLPGSHF